MPRYTIPTALLVLLLGGCAQLPAEQELAQLPIVQFGDPAPQDKAFILHFAAGKPIPSEVLIDGTLLTNAAKETLTVSLNKDVYAYKQWASFDGKHWEDARKLLRIKLDVRIPGYTHPQPGQLHLSVDTVPHSSN
jgi:hypothetical protein